MYSFYGGQKGQDFKVSHIFANRSKDMLKDLQARWYSPVNVGDYVFISYGDISERDISETEKSNYRKNLEIDLFNCGKSYANSLWQKVYVDDNKKISPSLPESENNVYVFINFDDLNTTAVNSIIEYNGKTYRVGADGNWYDKDDVECLKVLRYHQIPGQSLLESSDIYSDSNFGFGYRLIACVTGETPKLDVEYEVIDLEDGDPYLTLDLTIPENPKLKFYLQRAQVLTPERVGAVSVSSSENPSVTLVTDGVLSLDNQPAQRVSLSRPGLLFNLPKAVQYHTGDFFGYKDLSQIPKVFYNENNSFSSSIYKVTKEEDVLKTQVAGLIYDCYENGLDIENLINDIPTLLPYYNEQSVLTRLESTASSLPYGFYGITNSSEFNRGDHLKLLKNIYNNLSSDYKEKVTPYEKTIFDLIKIENNIKTEININDYIRKTLGLNSPDYLDYSFSEPEIKGEVKEEDASKVNFIATLSLSSSLDLSGNKTNFNIEFSHEIPSGENNNDYQLRILSIKQNPNCISEDVDSNLTSLYNDSPISFIIQYEIISNSISEEQWNKAGLISREAFMKLSKEKREQYVNNYKNGLNVSYSPVMLAGLIKTINEIVDLQQTTIDLLSGKENIFSSDSIKQYYFKLLKDIAERNSFDSLLSQMDVKDMYINFASGRIYEIIQIQREENAQKYIAAKYLGTLTAPSPSINYEEIPAFKYENNKWVKNKFNVVNNAAIENNETVRDNFIFQTPEYPDFVLEAVFLDTTDGGNADLVAEDKDAYTLKLSIPKGKQGDPGKAPVITNLINILFIKDSEKESSLTDNTSGNYSHCQYILTNGYFNQFVNEISINGFNSNNGEVCCFNIYDTEDKIIESWWGQYIDKENEENNIWTLTLMSGQGTDIAIYEETEEKPQTNSVYGASYINKTVGAIQSNINTINGSINTINESISFIPQWDIIE